jgi:hypothetical protein
MSSSPPARPGREAAQTWVLAFVEGWQAPASADTFADHFQPWFDPHIRLLQPQLPTLRGTLGERPVAWRVCDRATFRDGLVVERESYFDPTPLLRAALTRQPPEVIARHG